MKKLIFLLVVVLSVILAVGCTPKQIGRGAEDPPVADDQPTVDTTAEPDIQGAVLEVETGDTTRVLIDSTSSVVSGQIWVSITDDTVFYDINGKITDIDANNYFNRGQVVSVLSNGMIMESYPMQTSALGVFEN